MANRLENRVGEKFITTEGYEIEIIEYLGWDNCTVRFNNGLVVKEKGYSSVSCGQVKNLLHPSVYGIGYIGQGEFKSSKGGSKHCKAYIKWKSMLQRCYSEEWHKIQPTYKETTVDESWHNFQNFAKWFEENWKPWMDKTWQLDKDILFKGNKLYSTETCCFVPQEINSIFSKSKSKVRALPTGVEKASDMYGAFISKFNIPTYLGTFKTPEEAFQAYKTTKEQHLKEVAERWKDKITEQTYQALINYQVEITD